MWSDSFIAFGAIGLILLGMESMSSGLKTAAGPSLMYFLQRWTDKPLHGLLFGSIATIAVQSSTAITVATIGFVNASMLSLHNAAYVIYGSNLGTSLTGWFIALVGLQFKVDILALPIIGFGAILKLFSKSVRHKGIGDSLIGFGMLFLGLSFLKDSFDSVFVDIEFTFLSQLGLWGILLAVLLGVIMTVIMQASVAVIALLITAVSTGVLPLPLAAAFVIGANMGTTSTAIMATLAATAKAKRLAWLHVLFNVLTGVVALFLLKPLLWLITETQLWLFDYVQPELSLALFHTVFNILGVLLMWPITRLLVKWLNTRFRRQFSGQLHNLDASNLSIPSIALKTFTMEMLRVGQLIATQALALSKGQGVDQDAIENIKQIQTELAHYITLLVKQSLSEKEADALNKLVQNQLRLEMTLQLLPAVGRNLEYDVNALAPEESLWETIIAANWSDDSGKVRRCYHELIKQREQIKKQLYQQVLAEQLTKDSGGDKLLRLAELRRFNQQLTKAMLALSRIQRRFEPATSTSEEAVNAR